jgi:hypothetical protein
MGARTCTLMEKLEEGMPFLLILGPLCSLVDGLQDLTTKLFV